MFFGYRSREICQCLFCDFAECMVVEGFLVALKKKVLSGFGDHPECHDYRVFFWKKRVVSWCLPWFQCSGGDMNVRGHGRNRIVCFG